MVDVEAFGAFSLAMAVFFVSLELMRPLALEPLIVRHSGSGRDGDLIAASGALSLAMLLGLLVATVTAAVAAVVGGEVGGVLAVIAACLPFLFLQDACRYVLFSQARMVASAWVNATWLLVTAAGLLVLLLWDATSAPSALAVWGFGAACSAALALGLIRLLPAVRGARAWLLRHRDLSFRYVTEVIVDAGAFQLTLLAVGVQGGLAALAAFNGARVLLGPLSMLYVAAGTFTVSEGARMRGITSRGIYRLLCVVAAVLGVVALSWSGALLALPSDFGELFLGDSFAVAEHALAGLGVYWAAKGAIDVFRGGLRLAGLSRRSLHAMLAIAPFGVLGGLVGATLGGAAGAAWGLGITNAVGAIFWWRLLPRQYT
ncbi:hypothetical protein [Blastococcus sp. SYSU DS0541]